MQGPVGRPASAGCGSRSGVWRLASGVSRGSGAGAAEAVAAGAAAPPAQAARISSTESTRRFGSGFGRAFDQSLPAPPWRQQQQLDHSSRLSQVRDQVDQVGFGEAGGSRMVSLAGEQGHESGGVLDARRRSPPGRARSRRYPMTWLVSSRVTGPRPTSVTTLRINWVWQVAQPCEGRSLCPPGPGRVSVVG